MRVGLVLFSSCDDEMKATAMLQERNNPPPLPAYFSQTQTDIRFTYVTAVATLVNTFFVFFVFCCTKREPRKRCEKKKSEGACAGEVESCYSYWAMCVRDFMA
jgi:hypothetical protein